MGLSNLAGYRSYLEDHPDEWKILEAFCWISISSFYRDQGVFQHLEREILPQLAEQTLARGECELRCWSAGCAGGEEPYTLAILWRQRLEKQFSAVRLRIIATDIDSRAIQRAQRGCYRPSSLKQLPLQMRHQAFDPVGEEFCLKDEYRSAVTFAVEDIRERAPEGTFCLILCRNMVFTYFAEGLQRKILERIVASLIPGGALLIGKLECLPKGPWGLEPWSKSLGTYRKI